MTKIQTMSVGSDILNIMYRACLLSYLKHGHEVVLYTYEDIKNVPEGVIVKSGEEVLPKDRIFKAFGTYSSFANMFRYAMLLKNGGWWVDADTFCLKPFPKIEEPLFAGLERRKGGALERNNGIIYCEPENPIIQKCYDICMAKGENLERRGTTGPLLISEMMKDTPVDPSMEYSFGGLHWYHAYLFFTTPPNGIPKANRDVYCYHWYGHTANDHIEKGVKPNSIFAKCMESVGEL
jgi:hypothetical protein